MRPVGGLDFKHVRANGVSGVFARCDKSTAAATDSQRPARCRLNTGERHTCSATQIG
jgi:hypothetical protein